ncbi:MAG: TolC family protein [Candidatus Hydrogenedentes bacterium]|nr:TolC family protein [Candidatus Hydrogenedentota bacterium]
MFVRSMRHCLVGLVVLCAAVAGTEEPIVEDAAAVPEAPEAESAQTPADLPASPEAAGVLPAALSLEAAQQRALKDNPSLQAVEAVVLQAEQRIKQARSLYLPQVDLNYSATHTHLPNNAINEARDAVLSGAVQGAFQQALFSSLLSQQSSPIGTAFTAGQGLLTGIEGRNGIESTVDSYNLGLSASYILFNGFSRKYRLAIARIGLSETGAAYQEAQRLILFAVAESYYGVQLAQENIGIAQADEAFNLRLLKEAQLRREAGTGSKSDVLNFEVLVRAAQAARIFAERDYQVARIALATLMGIPEGMLPESVSLEPLSTEQEPEPELVMPEADPLVVSALEARPDVAQARHALDRNAFTVKERRSVYYPQVAAFASRDAALTDNSRFDEGDFSATVGLQVGYSVFAGGRNRARVKEAKFAEQEAEARLADAELGAANEVRQSLVYLDSAQQQLRLQQETAAYVEENRNLVEKEYKAGQAALARLNQAQRDLTEAQGRLALARVSLRLAWYQLRTSTAESLQVLSPEQLGQD